MKLKISHYVILLESELNLNLPLRPEEGSEAFCHEFVSASFNSTPSVLVRVSNLC